MSLKPLLVSAFAGSCVFAAFARAAEHVYTSPVPPGANPAAFPAPKDSWYEDVQNKFTKYGDKHADIVFDGDSITNRWEATGRDTWKARYEGIAADFGIEGDRVQNLLWRLRKGQVDGVDPKVVVLMIGTNNTYFQTAGQIAEGIAMAVREYKKRCPKAHVILMAVFPRGETPQDPHRVKMAAVNNLIAPLGGDERVTFIDIGDRLIEPDGTISREMMPDFLHPAARGYEIWADAIQPVIDRYVSK